jgi:transcriptional regulator with XRE-family HTH domain
MELEGDPEAENYSQRIAVQLAANLRAERARAHISGRVLAARMQRLGFRTWAMQTVSKVENAQRPVFATEILGLALALGTTIPRLMPPAGDPPVAL